MDEKKCNNLPHNIDSETSTFIQPLSLTISSFSSVSHSFLFPHIYTQPLFSFNSLHKIPSLSHIPLPLSFCLSVILFHISRICIYPFPYYSFYLLLQMQKIHQAFPLVVDCRFVKSFTANSKENQSTWTSTGDGHIQLRSFFSGPPFLQVPFFSYVCILILLHLILQL